MKIKIAYTEPEKERAEELAALYFNKMNSKKGTITLTRSDRYKPFYHIYISDKKKTLDNPKNI